MAKERASKKPAEKVAKPKADKPPAEVFLITEADNKLGSVEVAPGRLSGKRGDIGAFGPNEIAYYMLSSSNGRYLHLERVWPVTSESALELDAVWGRWRFDTAEVGTPLELSAPTTWTRFLAAGMRKKPKKKTHPSALTWPAIKNHVDVLRVLLAAGVEAGDDDPLTAAAAFHNREATELLAEHGFDVKQSIRVMERYKNEGALEILRSL